MSDEDLRTRAMSVSIHRARRQDAIEDKVSHSTSLIDLLDSIDKDLDE